MFTPRLTFKENKEFKYDVGNKTINGVPIWMLFMDKSCHKENDSMYFDKFSKDGESGGEPGYNQAMTSAFEYILGNPFQILDAEVFKKIHHLCVKTVKNVNSNEKEFFPAAYGLALKEVTKDAKVEWETDKLIKHFFEIKEGYLAFQMPPHLGGQICSIWSGSAESIKVNLQKITTHVNSLFHDYYSVMKEVKTNEDKLEAIVSLCRNLEIGHFFPDGNQRTIVFVLLNKLLFDNGFLPTILDNPYVFDGYLSRKELVRAVQAGQEYFLKISGSQEQKEIVEKTTSAEVRSSKSSIFSNSSNSRVTSDASSEESLVETNKPTK
jgi:hypothetical protein